MNEHQRKSSRDFVLLTYGVFLGIISNFLVEYVIRINLPLDKDLPSLILLMLFLLGFYLIGAWYLLSRYFQD